MTKIISIVSGKGGVGKTTSAINLSIALTEYGKNVALIDANLTTPNIGIYLGVPSVPVSLHSVLQGKNKLLDAMYEHPSGVKVIPGDIAFSSLDDIDLEQLEDALLDLEGIVDYVVIDGAAGLGEEAAKAISVSDGVIVITNPEMPAVTDALKAVKLINDLKKPVMGVVISRFKKDGLDMEVKEIESVLEYPVIGAVQEDDNIRKSTVLKKPVLVSYPDSEASKNYMRLGAEILGVPYEEEKKIERNFLDKLKEIWKNFNK